MKVYTVIFLLICLSAQLRVFAAGLSAETNGVYLAIVGWRTAHGPITNEPIRFDDKLVMVPFCNTGRVHLRSPLDPAYGIRVKMYDANGRQIPLTKLGKRYGSQFDRLKSYKDTRTVSEFAEGPYEHNPGLGGGIILTTPEQLFKIKKPGVYTLEVEVQMFRVGGSTNQWSLELFRFPPVKIKVEKPDYG